MRIDSSLYATPSPETCGDTKDCTVRALRVAFAVPYDEAREVLERNGRVRGRGATGHIVREALAQMGGERHAEVPTVLRWNSGLEREMTLAQFTKRYGFGRYVVECRRHLITVIDGVVHDWPRSGTGPRSRVRYAWRVWGVPDQSNTASSSV